MYSELLSPAKDKETAIDAIDCGCDAVYIGASSFGARQNAGNSIEDIREVVEYAHKFWVKVFVTVNTILTDSELEEAVKLVLKLNDIGVDAIIVQDMGLVNRLFEAQNLGMEFPALHISTQCDNRDSEKVEFWGKIGASRVVLARELSLEHIQKIHEKNPSVEIEAFVHGALCVSYSGQCYLSQFIGGRSANRGECAQPCRKKYSVETVEGNILAKGVYALCLKDFNASENLKKMLDAGVYSFKIEGRLKDSNYVKNVTAYYRNELDKFSTKSSSGRSFYEFQPNPSKSFNRGFTDYFQIERKECFNLKSPKSVGEYLGKISEIKNNRLKIKTNKNISSQDGLTNGVEGFLVNKFESGYIYANKNIKLKIGDRIYRNLDVEFEKELSKKAKRKISLEVKTYKDNDSIYLELTDEDGVSENILLPSGEKAQKPEKMTENFIKQFSKTGESDFYISEIKVNNELSFIPVSEINRLRRDAFEKLMQKRLQVYKREICKKLSYSDFYKKELDYRANVHNSEAKRFYEKCGAKVCEMSLESKMPEHQVELMRTKHCIKYALNMCKSPQKLLLRDEFGKAYPLKFDCKNCEMVVLSPNL